MTSFFTHGGMNLVLYFLLLVLVAPWIIALTDRVVSNETTSFADVLGSTLAGFPPWWAPCCSTPCWSS
jgi:hypothetical protein